MFLLAGKLINDLMTCLRANLHTTFLRETHRCGVVNAQCRCGLKQTFSPSIELSGIEQSL